jgi:hypothetical protein
MVPIDIADHEESYAGDQTEDAACRTVDELRETRLIESYLPTHEKPPFWTKNRELFFSRGMEPPDAGSGSTLPLTK